MSENIKFFMPLNTQHTELREDNKVSDYMGVGRIFSRRGPVGDFPKMFSRGGQKW